MLSPGLTSASWPAPLDLESAVLRGTLDANPKVVAAALRQSSTSATGSELFVRAVTWNMHGKHGPSDVECLVGPRNTYHVLIVGTQECERSAAASMLPALPLACGGAGLQHLGKTWEAAIGATLGKRYFQVSSALLGAIHVWVFAHAALTGLISDVQTASVPCGVGDRLGNKGGVGVGLTIGARSFLFVNAHLAAHQHSVAARNRQFHRIDRSLPLVPSCPALTGAGGTPSIRRVASQARLLQRALKELQRERSESSSKALQASGSSTGRESASSATSSTRHRRALSMGFAPQASTSSSSFGRDRVMSLVSSAADARDDERGEAANDATASEPSCTAAPSSISLSVDSSGVHSSGGAMSLAGRLPSPLTTTGAHRRSATSVDARRRTGSTPQALQTKQLQGDTQQRRGSERAPGHKRSSTRSSYGSVGSASGMWARIWRSSARVAPADALAACSNEPDGSASLSVYGSEGGVSLHGGSAGWSADEEQDSDDGESDEDSSVNLGKGSSVQASDEAVGSTDIGSTGEHDLLGTLGKLLESLDVSSSASGRYDHTIWMGDLNYRINGSRDEVHTKIVEGDQQSLASIDQLTLARRGGDVFGGFDEGPLHFLPTYKYDLHSSRYDSSRKARVPAWTDRILFKTRDPEQAESLRLLSYNALDAPELRQSDHRPVVAVLALKLHGAPFPADPAMHGT